MTKSRPPGSPATGAANGQQRLHDLGAVGQDFLPAGDAGTACPHSVGGGAGNWRIKCTVTAIRLYHFKEEDSMLRLSAIVCLIFISVSTAGCSHTAKSGTQQVYSVQEALALTKMPNKMIIVRGYYSNGPDGYVVTQERFSDICISLARTKKLNELIALGSVQYMQVAGFLVESDPAVDEGYSEHGACESNPRRYFFVEEVR